MARSLLLPGARVCYQYEQARHGTVAEVDKGPDGIEWYRVDWDDGRRNDRWYEKDQLLRVQR